MTLTVSILLFLTAMALVAATAGLIFVAIECRRIYREIRKTIAVFPKYMTAESGKFETEVKIEEQWNDNLPGRS